MATTPATQVARELPRYKSHKLVWALKIRAIDGNVIVPEEDGYANVTVSDEYLAKHQPKAGGYYVVYADGYKSWSPAEAFEQGYTAELRITPAANRTPLTVEQVEQIAHVCYGANRAYCASIGDTSHPAWSEAPQWQKDSLIAGVNAHLDSLDAGRIPNPRESHEGWLKQKAADGWKYGPTKNAETKEHPCFVPYDELPAEQKVKDFIFVNIVRAFFDARG